MLAVGIVDQHHGEHQPVLAVEGAQAEDSGGGLLAASYHSRKQFWIVLVDHRNKVSPIVDDDVGADGNHTADSVFIFRGCGIVDREDVEAVMYKCGRDVVLGRKRVAAGDVHLGSAEGEHLAEVGCLGLQMHRQCYGQAFEGLCLLEFLFESAQERHVVSDPLYLQFARRPKFRIAYLTHCTDVFIVYAKIVISPQESDFRQIAEGFICPCSFVDVFLRD